MKSCLFVLRSQKSALPGPSSPPQHSADIDSSCSLLGMLRSWAWTAFHMGGWQSISYLSVHQGGFWSISILFIWILGVWTWMVASHNSSGYIWTPCLTRIKLGVFWKSSIPSKWRLYYGWILNQLVGVQLETRTARMYMDALSSKITLESA